MNLRCASSYRLTGSGLSSISDSICSLRQPKSATPLGNGFGLASKGQPSVVSTIVILLYVCSPATILGGIAQIIVDSFKCFAGRAFTHVRKEVFECVPSLANGNATPSVAWVSAVRRVQASTPHPSPYDQYGIRSAAARATMEHVGNAAVDFGHGDFVSLCSPIIGEYLG